jgi:RNA polymerase sigma-70 factor (family 1)
LPENQPYNERELFARIANGDGVAFTELFRLYFEPLKWNALKILKSEFWAEEIVQEVFMQLWSNRDKLVDVESPAAYLFKVTANRCLDRIRRQELEVKMQYVVNKALHRDASSVQENSYDLDLIETLIKEAVQQLPEQGRLVFELQRNKGLSYQEIADRLGISRNTVRNHMVKSLHFIRSYLRQKGEIFVLLFGVWYFF